MPDAIDSHSASTKAWFTVTIALTLVVAMFAMSEGLAALDHALHVALTTLGD
jgi:hypothetical protein